MRLLLLVTFCCVLIVVNSKLLNEELIQENWLSFKNEFSKEYNSEIEEEFRQKIFVDNLMEILEHNEKYKQNLVTYEMGVNQFTDKLHSEYLDEMFSNDMNDNEDERDYDDEESFDMPEFADTPEDIDWVKKGAVTRVKDQRSCGGCYAFATTGLLEGANWIANEKLIELSEQNIIDCSRKAGNRGCNGGWVYKSLDYIKKNKGIDTEKSYRYQHSNRKCRFKAKKVGANVKNYVRIPKGNETLIKQFVGEIGPVAISADSNHRGFKNYKTGVFYQKDCGNILNHAMLIVGYGTWNGIKYWKVKNSWGAKWGMRGYILMARDRDNHCGIASLVYSANAEKTKKKNN